MESIEVLPGANLIKFFGDFEMDKVIKADGIISGFSQSPVQITSQGSDIHIQVDNALDPGLSPLLNVGQDLVEFLNIDSFDMYEPKKTPKSSAFSTTFPNFGLPKGVQSLHVKKASVSRITSALNDPLSLQSDSSIRLRGNEGLRIKGKELLFRADQNLHLRSINGSIILDSYDGVSLDVASLGISPTKHDLDSEEIPEKAVAEYKMCICMPQGVLFRIPVLEGTDTIHCDSIDLNEDNPCM
nr:EOG090X0F7H [Polyphemus pediculus]